MKALLRQCFFISIITEDFALKRTTNYALPDWEKSDFIQMSDYHGSAPVSLKKAVQLSCTAF